MGARDDEARTLARCVDAARDDAVTAADDREANAMRVAAMLIRSRHPLASRRLLEASGDYFARHRDARRPVDELVRSGWVTGLPRFRAMLEERLGRA